jgi:predicted amidohydrolase YtcJ
MYADALYLNGLIYAGRSPDHDSARRDTGAADSPFDEPTSLAIADGRVLALGSAEVVSQFMGPETLTIDLGGRRVVPGLIDGHMHAVRAGASWDQELHWTDVKSVGDALRSIRAAAAVAAPGAWIRAVGGWHPSQFAERRVPTRGELDEAGGEHRVYVQALYEEAVLNTAALCAIGIDAMTGDLPGGRIERDANGDPTGVLRGMGAFSRCLSAMGSRSVSEQRISTAAMLRQLHARGLTGIVDPGGFAMPPVSYDAIDELDRDGELTMRMRLFASAVDAGQESDQLNGWLSSGKDRFDGDMLRLIGIGEVVHYGCHDFEGLDPSFAISTGDREELLAISRRTARSGWPMHIHAVLDSSIDAILDCWEVVDQECSIKDLRFNLVHADAISARNIARLGALGVGVIVDDHLVFKAQASEAVWGEEAIRRAPPLREILDAGIAVAAGTDASRASSFNPWLAMWWLVKGQSIDGVPRRSSDQSMTRHEALDAYTTGSARLSFEESERGHLHPGALADFAVLSADYMIITVDDIPAITSDLTVLGGRHVHSSGVVVAQSLERD